MSDLCGKQAHDRKSRCGLSCAGLTHQAEDLAFADLQLDIVDCFYYFFICLIMNDQIFDLKNIFTHLYPVLLISSSGQMHRADRRPSG